MNFVSKLPHTRRMPQFQTLIKSHDIPLNMQTLTFVVFIDATMLMLEMTNG